MSHLDEWASLIAKQLKSDAELVSVQAKSELYEDAARDTFVRTVLEPFLPRNYSVGSGRVLDASGHISSAQDIVIYRGDYPQFNLPGSHNVFMYESVLATIQVCSKLIRKTFFSAMDRCASMGTLNPEIDSATLRTMAAKMKMKTDARHRYVHSDPLTTNRFHLIGRPQGFIYAFTGYQTSDSQLAENLNKWVDRYHQDHDPLQMKSLPSVIATQGCFAWRNTAPFPINESALMGIGIDHAPLRLMIVQLMFAINRRLQSTSDGYGIKSNIAPYLSQFEPPAISTLVGMAKNPGDSKRDQSSNRPRIVKLAGSADATANPSAQGSENRQPETKFAGDTTAAGKAGNEAVIKNLSPRRPARADESNSASREAGKRPQPSPLSAFNKNAPGEVEEYQFKPVDPSQHRDAAQEPEKQVDTSQDDALDRSFLDTLSETAENLSKDDAKRVSKKKEYVTESLI